MKKIKDFFCNLGIHWRAGILWSGHGRIRKFCHNCNAEWEVD